MEVKQPRTSKILRETKSFGGEPSKDPIYGGVGVWGTSSGGNALGEVEEAEGDGHGALAGCGGKMGKKTQRGNCPPL